MTKKAILLIAYGISTEQAENTFNHFCLNIQQSFPNIPLYIGFTSGKRYRGQQSCFSVEEALGEIRKNAHDHVYVLPLYLIPGIEYNELYHVLREFSKEHSLPLDIVTPLFQDKLLLPLIADILLEAIGNLPLGFGTLFMAHGTQKNREPIADALYVELGEIIQKKNPFVFLACMKGSLDFETVLFSLKEKNIHSVYLLPLLTLIGRHATEDMAGRGVNSWKSKLEQAGFICFSEQKALLEYPLLVKCWIDKLNSLMEK